jgi:RNA polymerase sigma factor (sigma-70 family)
MEDADRCAFLRGHLLRNREEACGVASVERRFEHMAATETGHLAAREIDDLYRAHVAEVYRYAYAVLGNHADAEDVTQTTFLNAYRALEQGVRPRKPSNWLLTIASNAIKQRFRQEQARPRYVELDERIAHAATEEDDEGPTIGELLTALSKIPPQQRQAIVLREFEGRSYSEIAEILGVTTSALETLLFRARRSLSEELRHQLTCTEAQLAVSRSVDGRLGRKERRRLRDHLVECPDCARFARLQQRHRTALRGLALVPIPLSLTFFKGLEDTAAAAVLPMGVGTTAAASSTVAGGAAATAAGIGASTAGSTGGVLAGGIGLKAAAVVAAATVAGGTGVVGSTQLDDSKPKPAAATVDRGERIGQTAPRGVLVPGNGVALGKATAPGQTKPSATSKRKPATATAKKPSKPAALARARASKPKPAKKPTVRRTPPARSGSSGSARANAAPKTNAGGAKSGTATTAAPDPEQAPTTDTEQPGSQPTDTDTTGQASDGSSAPTSSPGSGSGKGAGKNAKAP